MDNDLEGRKEGRERYEGIVVRESGTTAVEVGCCERRPQHWKFRRCAHTTGEFPSCGHGKVSRRL